MSNVSAAKLIHAVVSQGPINILARSYTSHASKISDKNMLHNTNRIGSKKDGKSKKTGQDLIGLDNMKLEIMQPLNRFVRL